MTLPGADALSAALERVLARFSGKVRRVATRYRLVGDDVDELLQQVRLRLWQAQKTADTVDATPASYVYRTAVTAALDMIRRRQARRETSIEAPETGDEMYGLESGRTADTMVEETELARIVASCVDTITASRRPVVRMYLNGYRADEIAEALGWTSAKTRNLLYRGLRELREALAEHGITATAEEGTWSA